MNPILHKLADELTVFEGFDAAAFLEAHHQPAPVTIRLNAAKLQQPHFEHVQASVPWAPGAFYLEQRPVFALDPLWHAGAYYVQEASSMFLAHAMRTVVDLSVPLRVLDLCAAPGGKSTLLAGLLNEQSLLVSNEVIKTRASILYENMVKWGQPNTIVSNNDPKDFARLENYFDVIVIDAPCSGSGLFRREPEAMEEWSEDNVALCSQRQQRILADVLPALKAGGILIYSTCSYSLAEDEAISDWLVQSCQMEPLMIPVQKEWGIFQALSPAAKAPGYRFMPHLVKGEGLFLAAFRKTEGHSQFDYGRPKSGKIDKQVLQQAEKLLTLPGGLMIHETAAGWVAQSELFRADMQALSNALRLKKTGVLLGKPGKNEWIPEHELALCTTLQRNWPELELNLEDARHFLRRDPVEIDGSAKGWHLITHRKVPLGWAKLLPNRMNNYYPQDWRLRMKG